MTITAQPHVRATAVTSRLAERASTLTLDRVPAPAATVAKHCLLDWIGVTLAGSTEPLAAILADHVRSEGGTSQATLVGPGDRVTASQAALVNGGAGHALDYDDVLWPMRGHPTVAVAPVVFALGEHLGSSGAEVLEAFIAGVETACRVGILMGDPHYAKGFHATGTVGTFGAAAAATRLLGLDAAATATALGIAGTQAAGLRAMFGTMCKPFHAGKAAMNGLLAAQLAARGFTANDDVLDAPMGFRDILTDEASPDEALADLDEFYLPHTFFKYHAACYGTHASIEAARELREARDAGTTPIERVEVAVPSRFLTVCNIQDPTSGLEGKFSLRYTVALALLGVDTARPEEYSVENIGRPAIGELLRSVVVHDDDRLARYASSVSVTFADGRTETAHADVGEPMSDLDAQWHKLASKFDSLATPAIGPQRSKDVIDRCRELESVARIGDLIGQAVRQPS